MLHRGRRLRGGETIRRLVREHSVTTDDLLYPMFVTEERESREIPSMPGICRARNSVSSIWKARLRTILCASS